MQIKEYVKIQYKKIPSYKNVIYNFIKLITTVNEIKFRGIHIEIKILIVSYLYTFRFKYYIFLHSVGIRLLVDSE